ncbi:Octicosapeptide/Phox/Bem1p domain-containing protein [Quillaja saponaria]|uniref:Octicosapeptide/Phox/Bem1p domain-containing protein n=1 Tax=Quillaja saponaria TaxID=32244 RepID=A0AAD7LIP8_QUISA|nr:Octicosapeptide/Phox/Bem1p domain-containing protein [Quillaja saponaria]
MENYSYSSYLDSHDSSPRSREIDPENSSWDEPPSSNNNNNYKVKFMCSYGGKIQPRPHDNQLAYIGGDTKILAVDRNIKFSSVMGKLSSLCDADVCFKYQLPGEDLDALISVTNDEDLEHMMVEYDRLFRASAKPARMRLFLFPLTPSAPTSFGSNETKSERQWFVDALNSVQIQPLDGSSPQAAVAAVSAGIPDFLFGLDKGYPAIPAAKLPDSVPVPTVPVIVAKEMSAGSDCGSEDRHVIGEPVMSPTEIQRQIQELQRLQLANNEQLLQRKSDEGNARFYNVDYNSQNNPEKMAPPHAPLPVRVPVQVPSAGYLPERHMTTAGYPVSAAPTGTEQPVYLIPTPGGMYQATTMRQMTGQAGQPYYGVQRMVPAEMYNAATPGSLSHSQPKVGTYTENTGMVRPNVAVAEAGYAQVGYDSAGRQVFYTAAPGEVVPSYQVVTAGIDGRQGGGGALNQEGNVVPKISQTNSL